jgi:RNA polymerase sigma-70 factor (ECF subfamily)
MSNAYALPPGLPPTTDLRITSHFEQFVEIHTGIVELVCLRLLKDRTAAEDACQETFIAAWRCREWLRPNRAWLLKVATNKCLDELRRRSRHRCQRIEPGMDEEASLATGGAGPQETLAMNAATADALEAALTQLPWSQRVAVVLSDVEGWSYREIALVCQVPEGTVKSRIFRARRCLRQSLVEARFFDDG